MGCSSHGDVELRYIKGSPHWLASPQCSWSSLGYPRSVEACRWSSLFLHISERIFQITTITYGQHLLYPIDIHRGCTMAESQTKCLKRLKGGTRPQAVMALCSRPEYRFNTLEKISPAQHDSHVLGFVNALFAITGIGQKSTWRIAGTVLEKTFPYLHGGLTRAIRDGKGQSPTHVWAAQGDRVLTRPQAFIRKPGHRSNFGSGVSEMARHLARLAFVQLILDCWTRHVDRDIAWALAYVEKVIDIYNRHNVKWLHSPSYMPSRLDWAIQAFEKVGVRQRYEDLKHCANAASSREVANPQHHGKTVSLHTTASNGTMTFHWRPLEVCLPEACMQAHNEWEHYEDQILEVSALLHTVAREEARYWDAVLSHPYNTDISRLPGFAKRSLVWYQGHQYTAVPGYNSPWRRYEYWLLAIERLEKPGKWIAGMRMDDLEQAEKEAYKARSKAQSVNAGGFQGRRGRSASSPVIEGRSRSTSSSRSPSPAGGLAGFLRRLQL